MYQDEPDNASIKRNERATLISEIGDIKPSNPNTRYNDNNRRNKSNDVKKYIHSKLYPHQLK